MLVPSFSRRARRPPTAAPMRRCCCGSAWSAPRGGIRRSRSWGLVAPAGVTA